MKSSLPKSLVLSFFLIGIILGMVFIDIGVIRLPAPVAPQSDTGADAAKPEGSEGVTRQVVKSVSRTVAKIVAKDKSTAGSGETSTKAVTEPVICDQAKALAVRKKAQEIAVIVEQGKVLNVTLGKEWAYYTPGIRRSFVERFAASDTCLHGGARQIRFYFRGEQVASTDAHGAIELK